MSERRPSPGYIAALAGAAVLVLVAGTLLRRLQRTAEPVAPPSEASRLEELSRTSSAKALAGDVAAWVASSGRYVRFVPAAGVSGVVWGAGGQGRILVPDASPLGGSWPLRLVRSAEAPGSAPPAAGRGALAGGWALLTVRDSAGGPRSTVSWLGGTRQVRCGGAPTPALNLAAPLGPEWLGAGVFDVQSSLLGIVARCDEGYVAIALDGVDAALARAGSGAARLAARFGLELESPDSALRAWLRVDTGLVVSAVWDGSPAAAAGLRPGDVVLAVGGGPPRVEAAIAASDTAPLRLTIARGRARRTLRLAPAAAALPVLVPPGGLTIASVPPGTPADRAGLRPGDRVIAADGRSPGTTAGAEALRGPAYVVFRRGAVTRGVLVAP